MLSTENKCSKCTGLLPHWGNIEDKCKLRWVPDDWHYWSQAESKAKYFKAAVNNIVLAHSRETSCRWMHRAVLLQQWKHRGNWYSHQWPQHVRSATYYNTNVSCLVSMFYWPHVSWKTSATTFDFFNERKTVPEIWIQIWQALQIRWIKDELGPVLEWKHL